MWDVRTEPTKLHPANPLIPAPRSPLRKYAFVRNVADSPSMQPRLQKMDSIIKTLRNYILGAPVSEKKRNSFACKALSFFLVFIFSPPQIFLGLCTCKRSW